MIIIVTHGFTFCIPILKFFYAFKLFLAFVENLFFFSNQSKFSDPILEGNIHPINFKSIFKPKELYTRELVRAPPQNGVIERKKRQILDVT